MYQKAAAGVLGAIGTSYAAYKIFFPWLGKDISDLQTFLNARKKFEEHALGDKRLVELFEETAKATPDKYFIIFEDTIYTYGDILNEVYRIAHIARSWNLNKGMAVAVFMENEPAFVSVVFGLQKVGIPVALINYNLRQRPLEHSLKCVDVRAVITGSGEHMMKALSDVHASIPNAVMFVYGRNASQLEYPFQSLTDQMAGAPSTPVGAEARSHTTLDDVCIYIYTSGTTGLPKPAKITNIRALTGVSLMPALTKMTPKDCLYTTVPLFHSSGFIISLSGVVGAGATMVLRRKFSSSHFWEDCCKHKVTGIVYIGELIRYILAQPESKRDKNHCVRFAIGNGLRQDIWEKFQQRFMVPQIIEFFGATEGTTLLTNLHNEPGACGRYSPFMQLIDPYPKYLVKYVPGTDQPMRDKNGRCIKVKRGEPGLLLAAFPPLVKPEDTYEANKTAIEKKLARNVFKDGDLFFNYGDVLCLDRNYYFRFTDRIGDTFRWKGENVSTQEVANTLTSLDFILDANVYGVEVPGHEGRAGMACLTLTDGQKELTETMLQSLYKLCTDTLPSYARPLFIRLQETMELTGTYKQQKVNLVKDGFDPRTVTDHLYYMDTAQKTYVPLTESLHTRIVLGQSKL